MKGLYDSEYAKRWIRHAESGADLFRKPYLYPFMKKVLKQTRTNATVLDVGCGWGASLDYLPEGYEYWGVDPARDFLDHIKLNHPKRKLNLRKGKLPSELRVEDAYFDVVLCSMALHCLPDLEGSVDTLFSKVNKGGKVVLVDFNDQSEPLLRDAFLRVDKTRNDYVRGLYKLSEDTSLMAEIYFHKEKEIEAAMGKHGEFRKTGLGPLFIGYESSR
jgi:ubiquinone/menaquinone biosynthesis C-methylase UbiE